MSLSSKVKDRISNINERIGIYYCNLKTEENFFVGNCEIFPSLGIAKLVMMIEVFDRVEKGDMNFNDEYILNNNPELFMNENEYEQTVGILDFLHRGIRLTIEDLVKMMMIISDNTAFNVLFSLIGSKTINETLKNLGLVNTKIEYMLSESEKTNPEKDNHHSVKEVGWLLKMMYKGQLVSQEASKKMMTILSYHQRRNLLIYYANRGISVMQQTGFDEDSMHVAAIVNDTEPFILCISIKDMDAKKAENIIKDIAVICGDR